MWFSSEMQNYKRTVLFFSFKKLSCFWVFFFLFQQLKGVWNYILFSFIWTLELRSSILLWYQQRYLNQNHKSPSLGPMAPENLTKVSEDPTEFCWALLWVPQDMSLQTEWLSFIPTGEIKVLQLGKTLQGIRCVYHSTNLVISHYQCRHHGWEHMPIVTCLKAVTAAL